MFARIENNAVAAYPVIPQLEHPNTGFPLDWPGGIVEGDEYAAVIPVDVPQVSYTQDITEGTPVLIEGVWTQTWVITEATEEEASQRTEEESGRVRDERNARLAASDWTQLGDAPVQPEPWITYRKALRDISKQAGFPWNVDWPIPPNGA